jgi:hypothetical protein
MSEFQIEQLRPLLNNYGVRCFWDPCDTAKIMYCLDDIEAALAIAPGSIEGAFLEHYYGDEGDEFTPITIAPAVETELELVSTIDGGFFGSLECFAYVYGKTIQHWDGEDSAGTYGDLTMVHMWTSCHYIKAATFEQQHQFTQWLYATWGKTEDDIHKGLMDKMEDHGGVGSVFTQIIADGVVWKKGAE